jgi:hypothetical protein
MAGLAPDAARFFKFLFILILYSLAMTFWVRLSSFSFPRRRTLTLPLN